MKALGTGYSTPLSATTLPRGRSQGPRAGVSGQALRYDQHSKGLTERCPALPKPQHLTGTVKSGPGFVFWWVVSLVGVVAEA